MHYALSIHQLEWVREHMEKFLHVNKKNDAAAMVIS